MKVFKFGGASVKDANAVRNVGEIIRREGSQKLVVVVSAMGKSTNELEGILDAAYRKTYHKRLQELKMYLVQVLQHRLVRVLQPLQHLVNHKIVSINLQLQVSFNY